MAHYLNITDFQNDVIPFNELGSVVNTAPKSHTCIPECTGKLNNDPYFVEDDDYEEDNT